jgi:hypothetical protein
VTDQLRALPHEFFQQYYRDWEQCPATCGFPKELTWRGWYWFLVQLLIKKIIGTVALLFRHTLYIRESSVPRDRSPENTNASGNSENSTFYTQYLSMWLTIFLGGTVNWIGPDSFTSWSKGQHSNAVVCKLGKTMKICLQICCLFYFHIRYWP